MASTSSREAALERRKALTTGGKKAAGRFTSAPNRVRGSSDARPSRTNAPAAAPAVVAKPAVEPVAAAVPARRSLSAPSTPRSNANAMRRVSNPSRDLVLARREALSRSGKRANTSKDRTRTDLGTLRPSATTPVAAPTAENKPCGCKERERSTTRLSLSTPSSSASERRSPQRKGTAQHNPSRALVLARREALSKRGKSASTSSKSGAAAVARQINPDLNGRELAQKVRELKSKSGSAGTSRSGGTRPTGPNRHGAKQAAVAADAHWKVGVSQTTRGQVVTGTQANRSAKTTGNEAATCRTITGTEYLGAEVFQTFCNTTPAASQPAKVRITATSHGNRVTGNEVGRSEKVTGDEPGTCKTVTGTEYVSANQAASYCGSSNPSPRKVGRSQTLGGQPVSGVMVGRSSKVTGDEPGSGLQLTGDQYLGAEPPAAGRAPVKVASQQTLRGTGVTGTAVGRSERVTGDEPGSCRNITGTPYVGADQLVEACGAAAVSDADFPQPLEQAPWQNFSVQSPARAAHIARQRGGTVTGTSYEQGNKITGPFDLAGDKVTGTEQFRFDRRGAQLARGPIESPAAEVETDPQRPTSRVTGEGISAGLRITGDDWDRGERVTGTEGASARRRNPTRSGPMSAMSMMQFKRNDEVPEPVSRVTGSSGNTSAGSLITVSGGARG